MKRTLVRGSLFLAAAALATSGLIASPAGAATAQQTCKKLTGTVNIKPGIGADPAQADRDRQDVDRFPVARRRRRPAARAR